ncbi:hypothetical protein N7481_012594 [Penicillium waksmanii]|uniref:uncharacterized protein n=1 Tax=Penicillium waksmanii TaxID=69791 RepID=UPI002547AAC2|nr:uncharacterized protein N7481_012594 [Penicillium waksmanii]KAJ5965880.1 hypothetical protein N7481_012594 [Penicillium waksmanii]
MIGSSNYAVVTINMFSENTNCGFFIGAPSLAIGLWWFAWTIPDAVNGVHWIVPTLPLVLIGYAVNEFDTVLLGYLVDSYLTYSASGLAIVATIFCAAPPFLVCYGEIIRESRRFADQTLRMQSKLAMKEND